MNSVQDVQNIPRPTLAREVAGRFDLSDAAAAMLHDGQEPQPFFAQLVRRELYEDALRFAAHYFTPREAVWWGCLCAWQAFRGQPPGDQMPTLELLVRWVQEPTEAGRRAAYAAARRAGRSTVSANLAMAAFYSGGSISVPDQPHVDPPADQPARCVTAAVILASRLVPHELAAACQRHFLELAGQVSRGEAPWPPLHETTSPPTERIEQQHKEPQHVR